MTPEVIVRLLTNSGFHVLRADNYYLYLEDPACVLRSFETFAGYAWIILTFITGMLLFGWGIALIRGAKNDYFTNLRNLVLIFGTLSAVGPIVNAIWGGDLFGLGCKTISISMEEVKEILDAQNLELEKYNQYDLYENLEIYDTGYTNTATNGVPAINSTPDTYQAQSATANVPEKLFVSASESSNNDVIYIGQNGQKYRYTGGTRAWRNSNPGNLRYSEYTKKAGAIGQAGGFAVFPDATTGHNAMVGLLKSNSYNNLTIAGAIGKYAPKKENDTIRYQQQMREITGLDLNRKMNSLSDEELNTLVRAMQRFEGWRIGQITQI